MSSSIHFFQFMGEELFLWSDRYNNKHALTNLQSNHCNLKNPGEFSDIATVEEKALLPIQSVSYGPINFEGISASVVVNELTCYSKEQPEWSMKDQVKENSTES